MEKRVKVAIVINDFLVGGAQKQLTILLPQLDRERFDLSLITLFEFGGKKTIYEELPEWLPVYRLDFAGFHDIDSWFKLFRLLRKISPDLVISSLFFSNTLVRIMKPFLGYKVISREHNTYIDKTSAQIFLDKILSHLSYRIVAVSKTVAEFTSKQEGIPMGKFEIIHNGVDVYGINKKLSKFPSKDVMKEKLGFSASDKIAVNVSRLTEQKNHKLLIRAFSEFSDNHPEYKLIILGDGHLKAELNSLILELGKENIIFLLGDKENVLECLFVSEFFVSTSEIEGMSNAYLEAMACGVPVVATKTAGTDELIQEGKTGFFIDNPSVSGVVIAMEKLLDMGHEVFEKDLGEVIKFYDIRSTARKYELLLESTYNNA